MFRIGKLLPLHHCCNGLKSIRLSTHTVFNQSNPFENIDLYESDKPLQRAMNALTTSSFGNDTVGQNQLKMHGSSSGTKAMIECADLAEANKPTLDNFDQYGRRVDTINYNPNYHTLMKHGIKAGVTSYGYNQDSSEKQLNGHLIRAGLMHIQNQLEPGHCCPLVMTSACIPVLQAATNDNANTNDDVNSSISPKLWLDKVTSRQYDGRNLPIEMKNGATLGMSMTEKQGGSDVKANTTIAIAENSNSIGQGKIYRLIGHKWFTSAPMSDGFLTLAKVVTNENNKNNIDINSIKPTCFLVPRWLPDQTRNHGFNIMRLKNKLGDRANASSEVEYNNAYGQMIGDEGKGLQTILQMVQMTRLDCTIGAASGAKRALSLAINHCNSRSAFGVPLIKQPMMENVLTDLCLTSEACTYSMMRMAAAHARSTSKCSTLLSSENINQKHELELFRVGVAILKYYCTKSQPLFAYECMEIFGGNGYTDDFQISKLFRHSPLNSIWEGSGNVMALDVLRAIKSLPSFLYDMESDIKGNNKYMDIYIDDLYILISNVNELINNNQTLQVQRMARYVVDRLAIGYQASLLMKYGDNNGISANAFIQSRIRPAVRDKHNININDGNYNNYGNFGLNYGSSFVYDKHDSRSIINDNIPVDTM